MWFCVILILPKLIEDQLTLMILVGLLHGIVGYQWVIYGMHEGAGHGLFRNKNIFEKMLKFLSFHSCRLFFADPRYYNYAHKSHHGKLGTKDDKAQTNYVLNKRVIKSMLPGAGIIFPNDYCIHKGEKFSKSELISFNVGGLFLGLEVYLLNDFLVWWMALIALIFIGP